MKKKREIEKFGHNKKMEKNCQVRKKWIKLNKNWTKLESSKNCKKKIPEKKFKQQKQTYCKLMMSLSKS